ncbi:hypothetical protein [Streptomyces luteireticuli]|uniref:hypothetical protein n=1 Tax=Streptomyces luteireticuli TaxID=173858 RepID=UPI003556D04C
MSESFTRGFVNHGTVHGGQNFSTRHEDGATTAVVTQNGETTTRVTDRDGNETTTRSDGTSHTRYSDPQRAFEAMLRSQRNRRLRPGAAAWLPNSPAAPGLPHHR